MIVVVWLITAPFVNSICFIWDGVFIGATSTVAMRNSMLIATSVASIFKCRKTLVSL